MNIAKLFTTVTFLGLISLCAINAGSDAKLKKEIRSVKNSLKRMKKQLSDMRKSFEFSNRSGESVFQTAFRLNMEDEEDNIESDETVSGDSPEFYTVREHNGIIGIFDDGDELVREIDTSIAELDVSDRQSLLLGVRASTESELDKIVASFK